MIYVRAAQATPLIRHSRVSPLTWLRSISHRFPLARLCLSCPPTVFDLYPRGPAAAGSLTPVAPFAVAKIRGHRMIRVKSKFFNTSLRRSIASPASERADRFRFSTYEELTKRDKLN